MATQVQFRGGSTSEHSTFTGAAREITVDTTLNTVVVHDGSTAGGHPLANKHNPSFTGNVGIGTTSPSQILSVGSTTGRIFTVNQGTANKTILNNDYALELRSNAGYQLIHNANNSAGSIAFQINSGEKARIDSSGNVGIGTSSPTEKLEVNGNVRISGSNQSTLTIGSGNQVGPHMVNIWGGGSGVDYGYALGGNLRLYANTSTSNNTILAAPGAGAIRIATNGTERMRITSGGNVGIGSDNPTAKLDISEAITSSTTFNRANSQINITSGTGTGSNYRANLFFSPFNTSGNGSPAGISTIAGGNTSSTLAFYTNPDNQYSGIPFERVRIDPDGNVGIGKSSPTEALHINNGNVKVGDWAQGGKNVFVSTGLGSYAAPSYGSLTFTGYLEAEKARIRASDVSQNNNGISDLIFETQNGTIQERMRITSDGYVGIGTQAPQVNLDVSSATSPQIRITSRENSGAWGAGATIGTLSFYSEDPSASGPHVASFIKSVNETAAGLQPDGALTFGTAAYNTGNAVERMRIDAAGNVGIGTSGGATGFGNVLRQKASGGASGYFAESANSDTWLGLYSGTSTSDSAAIMYPSAGSLRIGTTTTTGTTGFSEKLRLTDNGRLGINTTAPGELVEVKTGNDRSLLIRGNRNSLPVDLFACDPVSSYSLRDMSLTGNTVEVRTGPNNGTGNFTRMTVKSDGIVNIANAPVYADNTAALAGGLVAGDIYRKSDGTLMITF